MSRTAHGPARWRFCSSAHERTRSTEGSWASAKSIASSRLDLPLPLAPTTTVKPGWKATVVPPPPKERKCSTHTEETWWRPSEFGMLGSVGSD